MTEGREGGAVADNAAKLKQGSKGTSASQADWAKHIQVQSLTPGISQSKGAKARRPQVPGVAKGIEAIVEDSLGNRQSELTVELGRRTG